jgi:hypothetical protein
MRNHLRTGTKLWPGEPGTERHSRTYGDSLVCVRYLYDPVRRLRFTTVEIVVDQGPWRPRPARNPDAIVPVRVGIGEESLYHRIKAAGAVWDREQCAWLLPLHKVTDLDLQARIVRPRPSTRKVRTVPPEPPKKFPTSG